MKRGNAGIHANLGIRGENGEVKKSTSIRARQIERLRMARWRQLHDFGNFLRKWYGLKNQSDAGKKPGTQTRKEEPNESR